jgi:predicted Zn-dependent peptidase
MIKDVFNDQMRHPVIGYEDTIDSFTREDFINYRKKYYGANNTILMIVGPQSEEEVFKACEKVLENHNLGNSEVPVVQEGLIHDYEYFEIARENISQCFLSYYFPTVKLSDFNAAHKCMLNALGGGMYSILNTEIREKLGLCYSISVMEYAKNKTDGLGIIHTLVAPENQQLAADKIIECIDDMTENGIDEKIFKCAKAKMLADWCKIMEDPKRLANSIAQRTLLGIDIDLEGDYQKVLNLTLEDVNEYAKNFFKERGRGCYVMVPK